MGKSCVRLSVRGMMLAVAIVALMMSYLGAPVAVECVALFLGAFVPIAVAPRGSRLRVAAWVASFYPVSILLSFYALWAFAWAYLGHPPRPVLDDPLRLMDSHLDGPILLPFILTMAAPLSLIACMLLPLVSIELGASGERGLARAFAPLWAWPVVVMSVVLVWLWDPLGILVWFLD